MNQEKFDLLKSHIDAFTRKDGSVVAAHDDKRQAAQPKPPAKAASSGAYAHPNVVGKPSKMVNGNWTKETGYKETEHTGKPTEAHAIHFAGKKYLSSSKTGTSMHDGTPTRAFNEDDGTDEGGHRVWLDDKAQVHADSGSEVNDLRTKYEAHANNGKNPKAKKAAAVDTHADHDDASSKMIQHGMDLEDAGYKRGASTHAEGGVKNGYSVAYSHDDGKTASTSMSRSKTAKGAWETKLSHK